MVHRNDSCTVTEQVEGSCLPEIVCMKVAQTLSLARVVVSWSFKVFYSFDVHRANEIVLLDRFNRW